MNPLRRTGFSILCFLALCCLPAHTVRAALSQPIIQQFFVPMPEADLQTSLNTIDSTGTKVGNTMKVTIAIIVGQTNTVIVYDQWEDGYENDLNNPTQPTTLIWGDGNTKTPAPGYPSNILPAGAVILLTNIVTLPRNPSVTNFDGRDRIGASKPVVVTRAAWGVTPGTVLTSASSVYDITRWGTNFMLPIGTNVNAAIQNFSYSAAYIMACQNGTVVKIDYNGDGVFELTNTLSMGQNVVVPNLKSGAQVVSSAPVQVHEVTGRIGSTYQSRSFSIRPMVQWGSSYHAAAGTTLASEVHNIFVYNPYPTNITVQYQTAAGSGSFVVTNKTNGNDYKFPMPLNSGANFFTTNGTIFYAVGANDSGAAASANQTHDWGYALQPDAALTTVALCGWSPGSDDTIAPPAPDANGSPVWVTPMKSTTIYVNYTGNPTIGANTAPNGQKYDTSYTVSALSYARVYNPTTKNMTGARVFTADGTLFTTVWGEDSAAAGPGNPYLDCGLAVLPFPSPTISKSSILYTDNDHDGVVSVGDTLQYTITVANQNTLPISDVLVVDNLPTNLTYVAGSTTMAGSALGDNSVPPALTKFPLDEGGIMVPAIPAGGAVQIQFLAVINAAGIISNSVNGSTADGLWNAVAQTSNPVIASNSPAPACSLAFSDSAGNAVGSYAANAGIYVTVGNNVFNLSSGTADTVQVLVKNDSNGDLEYLTLTETGTNTSVFRNTSPLPSSTTTGVNQQDGTLYAQGGQTLEVDVPNSTSCSSAYATVATSAAVKKLYLDSPNQILDRIDPVATGDITTMNTALLGSSSWKYRKMITIDHTKVGSGTTDEANFPVLISLSSDTDLSSHAQPSGNDIFFTASDGTTVLSYERESYSSGTLVAWVNVPILSHTADTVLYMYYGNSSASDQQNKTAVWDANYQGVWHLNQTPSATKPDILDSTAGANNGTSQGTTLPAQASGQIDGSLTLNSNNLNYISTANSFTPATNSSETVQAWIKTITAYSNKVVGLEDVQTGTAAVQADRQIYLDAKGKARFGTWNTAGTAHADMAISTSVVNNGTWHSLVGVRDNTASKLYLYVDGVLQATTNSTMGQAYTAGYWRIGSYHISATQWFGNDGYFNGSVDEVRVSQIARSADWISTEYNNEYSPLSFYTLGSETPVSLGNNTQFTQSPAFAESFTMPSGGAVSVLGYASVPSGTLSANPAITANLSYGTTTFATLTSPTATLHGGGSETISVVGAAASANSTQTAISLTFSYNSGTIGANRILMVGISYRNVNSETVSSVTYGGQTMTQVGGAATTTSGQIYIYSLLNPPTGANNLVVNWSSALNDYAVVGAVTYAGVSQTTPTGFVSATGSTTTPATPAITSATGQLVFGIVSGLSTSAYTPSGLWSARPTGTGYTAGAGQSQAGASSVTFNWTGTSAAWVAGGVSLQPAYDPLVYQLDWSGTLGSSPVTVPSGQAISLAVTNVSTSAFSILYDSTTYPAAISLPATSTNIISVDSLGLYTTSYPGTTVAGGSTLSGQTVYLRATVSDPFGAYDVNHLVLTITDPSANATSVTLNDAQVVATNSASKTYEYAWFAPATTGSYSFRADAFEGTEGITNSGLTSIYVAHQDLGVPSTTIFTYGPGGYQTNSYWAGSNIWVQVTDLNGNTNTNAIDTIPAVVTDSLGDSVNITLTETGPNTGIFTNSAPLPSSTGAVNVNDSTLEVQPGTLLTVTFTDPIYPSDVSSDNAVIKPTNPGNPSVSVFKTLVSPAGGLVQTNGTVQFNIQVVNSGGTTLSSVILTDTNNNTQLAFTGASATPTSTSVVGNTVSLAWNNLGPLAVGASTNISVNFTVLATGTFSNSAIVTGDATAGPSRAFVTGINTSLAIAKSIVSPVPGPAYISNMVVFFIGLTNTGTTTITNLPLEDDYSAGELQFVSASVPPAGAGGGIILWTNLGPLAAAGGAGAYTNIQVTFIAVGAASPTVNSAAVNYALDANGNPVPPVQTSTNLNIVGASLSGNIWFDANANAINDAGDSPLSGVIVFLDLNGNGVRDSSEPFVTTDASGNYSFNSLAAGTYSVRVDTNSLPAGVRPTFDTDGIATSNTISATLTSSQVLTNQNFGYTGTGSIGNYVWYDINGDGVAQANEPPLAGVRVFIDANGNGSWDSGEVYQYTTAAGYYDFTNLVAGTYNIAVDYTTLPAGVVCTGDPDATKNGATTTVLAAGQNVITDNFGFQGNASVSGSVLVDVNGNGVADTNDTNGIAGVTVTLQTTNGATIATTLTSASGAYSFTNLLLGSYVVVETNLTGWISTLDTAPPNDSRIPLTLTNGQASTGNNFYDTQLAQVSGSVLVDVNGNGVADSNDTNGIAGVTVTLQTTNGVPVATNVTSASGSYVFTNVAPGSYLVVETNLPGWISTLDSAPPNDDHIPLTLTSGQVSTNNNFFDTQPVTIGDYVWVDSNGNGVQDGGEPGLGGVQVILYRTNSGLGTLTAVATNTSSGAGAYSFTNVLAGDFVAGFSLPSGYAYTVPNAGANTNLDSNVVTTNGQTAVFTVNSGQTNNTVDAGYYQPTSISGKVVVDVNGNGIQDAADTTGIPSVTITLKTNGVTLATLQTDGSGNYTFTNLPPGSYTVVETDPVGYVSTGDTQGANDNQIAVTLVSGTPSSGNNFLDTQPVTIGDYVWVDSNGNGVQDGGEPGLGGVQVILYRTNSGAGTLTAVATNTSSGAGAYSFANVLPGDFVAGFSLPSGYAYTVPNAGGNTNLDSNVVTTNGQTAVFTVNSGQTNNSIDAGYYQPGSIGGSVLVDVNGNGVADPGDTTGIAGVTVTLQTTGGATIATSVTSASGAYSFTNLPPGSYVVVETNLAGWISTLDTAPPNDDHIPVTLASGQASTGNNFYDTQVAQITGSVKLDVNGNGTADTADTNGIASVTITLKTNGVTMATVQTDSSGNYALTNLPPGGYTVVQTVPAGYTNTTSTTVSVTLTTGSTGTATYLDTQPVTIGDYVWVDSNGNGVQDGGKPGLSGVQVVLYRTNSGLGTLTAVATNTSSGAGAYSFTNVLAGDFVVGFGLPGAYAYTTPNAGGNTNLDSNAATNNGLTAVFTLTTGQTNNSIDAGYLPLCALGNLVFHDNNGNGIFDDGDSGAPNVTVELYRPGDTPGTTPPVATTETDSNGHYYFDNLFPGTYFVHIAAHEFQAGGHLVNELNSFGVFTNDNTDHGIDDLQVTNNGISSPPVTLAIGTMPTGEDATGYSGFVADANNNFTIDFGFVPSTSQVTIGDLVFIDANNNGHHDAGEPGINGVLVDLWEVGAGLGGVDLLVTSNTTANIGGVDGSYLFGVAPGTYYVKIPASNFAPGGALAGVPQSSSVVLTGNDNNHGVQSGGSGTAATAAPVTLTVGQNDFTQDFGFAQTVTIGDYVWVDTNGNGVQDGGEPGLGGVQVILYRTNSGAGTLTAVATNTSSAGGAYSFTNVMPGDFVAGFGLPSGYAYTTPNAGGNTNLDSNVVTTNGLTAVFTLSTGQTNNSIDAGYYQFASIAGSVLVDVNGNGTADSADTNGVSPVVLKVYQGGTNLVATVTNNPDGSFSVSSLPLGNYTVIQTVPPGYTNTTPAMVNVTLTSGSTGPANYLDTPTFSIGNQVFYDNGTGTGGIVNNGIRDGAEPGITNVVLKLYAADGSGNPTGGVLAKTNTDANGYYRFDGLFAGTYVVVVDVFGSGVALNGMITSTGWTTNLTLAGDLHDHGKDTPLGYGSVLPGGIASVPVQVGIGLQPTNEAVSGSGAGANGPGGDASDNLAVDFGFYSPPPTAAVLAWLGAYVDTNGQVWVTWQTLSERDLLYFDVLRSAPSSALATDVTPDWVESLGGPSSGYLYHEPDPTVVLPGQYTYCLVGFNSDFTTNVLGYATVNLTTNNAGVIRITGIQAQTNGMLVQWVGGQPPYTLESQTSPGANWIPIGPAQPGETEVVVPATNSSGFYRVKGGGNE